MVISVPWSRQLLDPELLTDPETLLLPSELLPLLDALLLELDELLLLCDELLAEDMLPELDGVPSVELALPDELPPLPDVPPPEVPPPEVPPPDVPPPDVPPPDVPPPEVPPPLDDGVPSVLLIDELDGLLDGVAVSVLLDDELDTDSVELGVGVPGSLELGVSLLLRLDVPLPGGCWVVAHTGI
jgi:hypothetical protein